ncbi:MAG: endonuclease/exonuclease/phosphatase family protein, partial [Alphaproteobacteria bacterium]|nr:endonuclease/exonuclease/phosphatase family protein [Alphaproteobacteria bacterium]
LVAAVGWWWPTAIPPRAAATGLRVVHLNTYYFNEQTAPKLAFAAMSQADLVSLQEVSPGLEAQLATISSTYPHQRISRAPTPMALLSVYPLTRAQAWGPQAVLYHVGRPVAQGGAFYVLQIYPQSPHGPTALATRNTLLAQVIQALPNLPRPLLMVGDFNTVPWDSALQALHPALSLAGGWRAWQPSFPTWLPVTPLDHLYASPHWPKAAAQRARVAGTDHLGLVVDFPVR